jgi:phosphatidylglycerophosphatase A
MSRFFIYLFATFFGTGYAPIAPATVASFAFTVIWVLAGPVDLSVQIVLLVLVTAIGIPIATYVEKREGKDPGLVVSDEIAGMLVTFLAIETNWIGYLVGFLLFRFFDILKPYPVRKFEELPAGWGITIDDIAAGIYARIVLGVLIWKVPLLQLVS